MGDDSTEVAVMKTQIAYLEGNLARVERESKERDEKVARESKERDAKGEARHDKNDKVLNTVILAVILGVINAVLQKIGIEI